VKPFGDISFNPLKHQPARVTDLVQYTAVRWLPAQGGAFSPQEN